MRRVCLVLLVWITAWPAMAGPDVLEEIFPERPERHAPAPVEREAPSRPMPPPAERLPGPLTLEQQRLFDGIRSEGIALYHEGRYREAAQRFREALRVKPADAVTLRWLRATESRLR